METICLVIPPSIFLLDERVFVNLGILKLAAMLETQGYAVEVVDLSGISNFEEAIKAHAQTSKATWYGITATTPQLPQAVKIVRVLRANSKAKIVIGGPHPTLVSAAYKREAKLGVSGRATKAMVQMHEMFDSIVAGDGEFALLEVLKTGAPFVDGDDPKSTLFMTNKVYEASPPPARHLVDLESYKYTIDGVRATSAIFQLGCPFECNFCGGRASAMLRRIRTRSTKSILDEIRHLYQAYGYTGLMCYDDTTETLTEHRGWVKFKELLPKEKVAILLPKSGELAFEVPSRVIRLNFEGEMVQVTNRFVDLCVTPEHRMWARYSGSYQHITAEAMLSKGQPTAFLQRLAWKGKQRRVVEIPAYEVKFLGRNKGSPKVLSGTRKHDAKTWVQFLAWYLSEGSCYRPKVRNGRGYRICIKQSLAANKPKVAEIREVLTKLGYRFSYSSDQFHIDSKELYQYLKPFGHSKEKYVPQEIKDMSKGLIALFLRTYLKGDGTTSATGQQSIYSFSPRMRGDLQELALKAGYWATVDEKHQRVLLSQQRDSSINLEEHVSRVPYSGEVHCVTVSTGVVLVRRNGRPTWSGNCYDDELNVSKSLVELMNGIAELGKELGTEFRLRGFVKSELFTDAQAEAMYRAGFRWILTGFESGSPRILDNINKKATVEDNDRCMEIAHRHGLKVKALMSIGHPGESEATVLETRDWLLRVKPDDFDVTIITTYPGTPYYDHAVETAPGIWTYTCPRTKDQLHAVAIDYNETADYYKGDPDGGYKAYVYTDQLTSEGLVTLRNAVEAQVRKELNIPFNRGVPATRFEHSMGQMGPLPSNILRASSNG